MAFFSGTDNKDDHSSIVYSGVFGKLDKEVPQTVWRMNFGGKEHTTCDVADIFAIPMPEAKATPAEWLERVTEKKAYTPSSTSKNHGSRFSGNTTAGRTHSQETHYSRTSNSSNSTTRGQTNKSDSETWTSIRNGVQNGLGDSNSPYRYDPENLSFCDANTDRAVSAATIKKLKTADIDPFDIEDLTQEDLLLAYQAMTDEEVILLVAVVHLLKEEEDKNDFSGAQGGNLISFDGRVLDQEEDEDTETVDVDDSDEEEIQGQLLAWYKGLSDNPEAQLEALRSLYEETHEDAQVQLTQTGF